MIELIGFVLGVVVMVLLYCKTADYWFKKGYEKGHQAGVVDERLDAFNEMLKKGDIILDSVEKRK